jgi:hypothetical protein
MGESERHLAFERNLRVLTPKGYLFADMTFIRVAIRYVSEMRDKSNDAVVQRNANRTVAILKRLQPGGGTASAC